MIAVKLILQDYKNNGKMEKIDFRSLSAKTLSHIMQI